MTTPDRPDSSSDWDSLANELGLSPDPAPVAPPPPKRQEPASGAGEGSAPPSSPRQKASRSEHIAPFATADSEADSLFGAGLEESAPAQAIEPPYAEPVDDLDDTDVPADEVEESVSDEAVADEAGNERSGRRRRRRRRRRGGAADAAAAETPVAGETDEDEALPDGNGDMLDDQAPSELSDDEEVVDEDAEEKPAVPAALDEELEADAAEPLPEWNVMSWNDLIATLHRPER